MSYEKWAKKDRPWEEYPVGTKAKALQGGHWIKTERGWKWGMHGATFPTPGGDCIDVVLLPEPLLPAEWEKQIAGKAEKFARYMWNDSKSDYHKKQREFAKNSYVRGAREYAIKLFQAQQNK